MSRILKYAALILGAVLLALLGYGAGGYFDAMRDAERLRVEADTLIAEGYGGDNLGPDHLTQLLRVQDPAFFTHSGVDFTTPGAGATTISQSASKRLAFTQFRPGIGKIRQTGYALGLEQHLSKAQILALWLDSVEMGRGPDGWMTGFYVASKAVYGRLPAALSEIEFLKLTAVLIAPATFDLQGSDPALDERVRRIRDLLTGQCAPASHADVWLEGCR
ncbi:MAG: transglycosylase domain-containing protein [Thiothrix sp.]|nr:transglycosylase domain-containing protein [Thiothrix sp.]HPQ96674.1 transglycosylase domain-containing protein [Thiolinea sp.]